MIDFLRFSSSGNSSASWSNSLSGSASPGNFFPLNKYLFFNAFGDGRGIFAPFSGRK